ncbi:MAG: MFS transporter [Candidatus Eisenbacteria bacterium]|nr:MFS transporter [Candidatus Eisenbacteria bacterium]
MTTPGGGAQDPAEAPPSDAAISSSSAPPRGEPVLSQRISILEGSLAGIHTTITSGTLLTAYALMLGSNDFQLGLLSALAAVATVGSVVGAQVVGRLGRRKPLSVVCSGGGRALWCLLCLLPFLPIHPSMRLGLFLAVVFVGNSLVNLSATGWLSWMSDLVPIEQRGRYFGLRNTIIGTVVMLATFATGRIYDRFVARGEDASGLAWLFAAAAFVAALAALTLTRQWEPPLRGERPIPLLATLRKPFENRIYRRLLAFTILWSSATGMASPFFAAQMIKNLKMSFSSMAAYSILAGILNLVSLPLWGRIIDRVGNRPVLVFNIAGVSFLPLLWLFAAPGHLAPIWIDACLTGLFWPGFALASFNLVLATAPEENRTAYLGVQGMAVGLSTFLASLLGGAVAQGIRSFSFEGHGLSLANFHLLFILSALLRISLLPVALTLREERAGTVRALLGLVGDEISQRLPRSWQTWGAVLRRNDKPQGGHDRSR